MSGAVAGHASASTLLYQVDFFSDTVGSPAMIGEGPFPRYLPSPQIDSALGPGVVVSSAGPLDDQPVLSDQDGSSGF
jgi:hypothetical protein